MRDLSFTQFLGFLLLWTLVVAVVVDLVWCRPHRIRRIAAETRARRQADTIDDLRRKAAVRTEHVPARPLDHVEPHPSRYRPTTARQLRVVRDQGA